MKKKHLKKYWYRDWRDEQEYVTSAWDIKDLKRKVGTDRIQVLQFYYGKKYSKLNDLILPY